MRRNPAKTEKKKRLPAWCFILTGVSCLALLLGSSFKNGLAGQGAAKAKQVQPIETGQPVTTALGSPVQKAANYYKKMYQSKKAGTVVSVSVMSKKQQKKLFYQTKLTDAVFQRMYKKSYKKNCTVPKSDLRYVRVLYYGFDKEAHIGELVVNRRIAGDICTIFYKLYQKKYQIEKMVLVDEYGADDEDSMADNNTSSFNYRPVSGTARLSKHSYGMAIDINPLYNPYIHTIGGKQVCEPANGKKYVDRTKKFAHKITKKDLCCRLFAKYGFTWGGSWTSAKDYQHFEKAL